MNRTEIILFILLLSSIIINFVLAFNIDKIKEEVLINCNNELTYILEKSGCKLPPIEKKAVYVNIDDIITELPRSEN